MAEGKKKTFLNLLLCPWLECPFCYGIVLGFQSNQLQSSTYAFILHQENNMTAEPFPAYTLENCHSFDSECFPEHSGFK